MQHTARISGGASNSWSRDGSKKITALLMSHYTLAWNLTKHWLCSKLFTNKLGSTFQQSNHYTVPQQHNYFAPAQWYCQCLSVHDHISETTYLNFTHMVCAYWVWLWTCESVLIWQDCNMSCASITFFNNCPYGWLCIPEWEEDNVTA